VLLAALLDLLHPAWTALPRNRRSTSAAIFVVFALVWPLARVPVNLARDSSAQAATVRLGEAILPPGEAYLAGIDVLWRRHQEPAELAWLDQVRLRRLHSASGAEKARLAHRLAERPPRFLVANGRLQALPKPLLAALGRQFQPLHGNLLGYAPLVEPPGARFDWTLGGRFRVERARPGRVEIAGEPVDGHGPLILAPGEIFVSTDVPVRLVWEPEGLERLAEQRFAAPRELFPNVYSY
jgi:hypothetical protein